MSEQNQDPTPTLDGDQIVAPEAPEPQTTVGSEGGASLVGTPRRVETDADSGVPDRARHEKGASSPTAEELHGEAAEHD